MARKNTTEQEQIANAPVVEDTTVDSGTASSDDKLKAEVTALIEAQYGNEGEPTEGTERWDDIVREMVIDISISPRDLVKPVTSTVLFRIVDSPVVSRRFMPFQCAWR